MKRLSIITTTFRSSKYIKLFFKGVLRLNALDQIKVLIIMNEPNIFEVQVADYYENKYPSLFNIIKLDKRETVGASLNRGLFLSDTLYTSFLDVDDLRVPDSFERQMATLDENPEVDFTYGDYILVKGQGETDGKYISTWEFDKIEFTRNSRTGPTQLFRTELLKKIGGWDEQLRVVGDLDFQIRAAFNCDFKKTPGLLYYYTRFESSGSAGSNIPLWATEHNVLMLRYGWYDIMNNVDRYPNVRKTKDYRLDSLLINGEWQSVYNQVPRYKSIMAKQEPARIAFEKNYRCWFIKYYASWPIRTVKRGVCWILAKLGLLDTVRKLCDHWFKKK